MSLPEETPVSAKTLYDVSAGDVFFKNLLAGMGRALGGVLIQALFFVILGYFTFKYVWPQLQPMIQSMNDTIAILKQMQAAESEAGGSTIIMPAQGTSGTINLNDLKIQDFQK